MINRYCMKCGRLIVPGVSGNLCLKCKLDRSSESEERSPYYSDLLYTVRDIALKLGVSERTVRRKAHAGRIPGAVPTDKQYFFDRKEVDEWIKAGQPIFRVPTSPIQEKAYAMCTSNDHSWMAEEEYDGNSYIRESQADMGQNSIIISFVHTCYFCGHKEHFQLD